SDVRLGQRACRYYRLFDGARRLRRPKRGVRPTLVARAAGRSRSAPAQGVRSQRSAVGAGEAARSAGGSSVLEESPLRGVRRRPPTQGRLQLAFLSILSLLEELPSLSLRLDGELRERSPPLPPRGEPLGGGRRPRARAPARRDLPPFPPGRARHR